MWKRVVMVGAMAIVVVAAVTSILLVLDLVSAGELRDALARTLAVIGIVTIAILLLIGVVKLGMGSLKPPAERSPSRPPV